MAIKCILAQLCCYICYYQVKERNVKLAVYWLLVAIYWVLNMWSEL